MAAPAAPVAPGGAYLAIGLGLLLTWVAIAGMRAGWQHSIGALLRKLAQLTGHLWVIGGKLEDAIRAVDHFVLDVMDEWIEMNETALAKWWHAVTWVIRQLADTVAEFGQDTYVTIGNLVDSTIPNTVGAVTRPLSGDLAAFKRAIRSTVNQELQRFHRGIDALRKDIAAEGIARLRGIDELDAGLRGRVDALADRLRAEIADVGRYAHRTLNRRLTRLEERLAAGVIGGAALYALTRVFPYWQCTNVRSLNRLVCRSPIGALDDLFGLALLAIGPISIVALARDLQAITDFSAEAVNAWVIED